MRYTEISEAPISDIVSQDMNREGTFRPEDRKKIQSPEWQERVYRLFQSSPFPIMLYLINGSPENKITMTSKHFINRIDVSVDKVKDYVGIMSKERAETILQHPMDTEGKITAMMFHNEGSERVGLTPWIVAHRIAHMFLERNDRPANESIRYMLFELQQHLNDLFTYLSRQPAFGHLKQLNSNDDILDMARTISTFRSARTGNLRDSGEYGVELLAQFILKGKVTFSRSWIDGDPEQQQSEFNEQEQAIINAAKLIKNKLTDIDTYFLRIEKGHFGVEDLFNSLRGNPHRPRTHKALYNIIAKMVNEERYVRIMPKTEAGRYHEYLTLYEDRINQTMQKMLNYAVGKVLVL
jgi:predicted transcriptional regulator